ncbi:hypothetical protein [Thioalkalivibrio sp. ALMg9]|uniref:hypothetical protein n=1 Tax=Thioalkalivibrio sp. ALMg9 TaxID=1266912 RepID=UPI0003626E8E|nr:hypothetical protein [Thioalkalivibrio sp. ALMg9]
MGYQVLQPLRHNGRRYAPGDTLPDDAISAVQVENLRHRRPPVLAGEAAPAQPKGPADDDTPDPMTKALTGLDRGNEALWTNGGKPTVEALGEALGREVTAKERDAAWAAFTEGDAA